jgi:pimeloyl-ACP methyl ester carboxylesterase
VHTTRNGTGKPLLLVHGLGSSARTWDLIVPALAAQREVIAVDLPGFGETPPLAGPVTVATLTDAVEDFISRSGLGDVDVAGSSMGARMVLELARRGHPGSVVALDPGGFWDDVQVKVFGATVKASIALVRSIQPVLPALTRSAAGRTALLAQFSAHPWWLPPELVLTELRGFKSSASVYEALADLVHGPRQAGSPAGSLKGTVVIGWGRQDLVTLPSEASRAARLFPDATLHWFDRCGHFPHWDQPDQASELILAATG